VEELSYIFLAFEMSGVKRKVTTQDKRVLKTLRDTQGTRQADTKLERFLKNIDLIDKDINSGELELPLSLGTHVSLAQFDAVCDRYEDIARRLQFNDGTVLITEVLREAHEVAFSLVADQIKDQYTASVGRRTVKTLGGHDIRWGLQSTRADISFKPKSGGSTTATIIIQSMDSGRVLHGRNLATGILHAPNHVRAVLNIKLIRHIRPPVPQVTMGPILPPRTIGDNTFSDESFTGDVAPLANETNPVSEMIFLLYRRGVPNPTIVRSALGPTLVTYHAQDDLAIVHPGVPVAGGAGPFVQGDPNYMINIPWGDLYFCPNGVPPAIGVALAVAPAAGISIDPFLLWEEFDHDTRYKTASV